MASRRRRSFADQYLAGDAVQGEATTGPAVADRTDQELDAILEPYLARDRRAIKDLPIDTLEPSPFQARQSFDPTQHAELVASIKNRGFFGVISVRPHPDVAQRYQIVYGERRWRAAKEAGLKTIPAQIGTYDDLAVMDIGLMENIHRADPHPLDMAQGLRRRMDAEGLSVRQVSDRLGISKSFVENHLALLRLPEDVQDMVRQRTDTLRAAREISKLPTKEARAPLIAGVIAGELSKAEIARQVQMILAPPPRAMPAINDTPPTLLVPSREPAYDTSVSLHALEHAEPGGGDWLGDTATAGGAAAHRSPRAAYPDRHTEAASPAPSVDTLLLLDWQKECARIERAIVHWRTQLTRHQNDALRQRIRADIEGLQMMLQQMYSMVTNA